MIPDYQTDCDIENERVCFQARGEYLRSLKLYAAMTKQLLLDVKADANSLWKLSVKFNILRESCPKGIYPVEITDQVTCEILEAKQKLMHKIKTDISNWNTVNYVTLVESYKSFARSTKAVKWSYPNAFILGGPHERSLQFYVDSALDTMHYFGSLQQLVESRFLAITLFDSESILRFERVLLFSKQFEDLLDELLLFSRLIS